MGGNAAVVMFPKLFLTLPVEDLERSIAFYSGLGCALMQQCSDDRTACVALGDQILAVLQTRDRFATLTAREIVDGDRSAEAIFVLALETRERVDELADRALMAGGRPAGGQIERGRFYRRGFSDPDGHQFAVVATPAASVGRARLGSSPSGSDSALLLGGEGRHQIDRLSAMDSAAALDQHRKTRRRMT